MFYAMNRFEVPLDHCEAFEARWLGRDSKLPDFDGFVEFNLLRGDDQDGWRRYVSHTIWQSEAHFTAWLKSPSFGQAHRRPAAEGAEQVTPAPQRQVKNQFEALRSIQRVLPRGEGEA